MPVHITATFLQKIREEKKFSSHDELVAQLLHDKQVAQNFI